MGDEFLSQLEVAKETMQKVHEEMALQEQQHLSYTETSEEILKSMELKLNARENELDDIQVQQKEKLDEREKENIRLREERESNEVEMEEKMQVIIRREKESNGRIRKKDLKIEEQLEAVNSLKSQIISLKNEISDMRIVMESTTAGLLKERLNNDIKDSTIEELNEKVCWITEEKMRMEIENDKSIVDLELSKKLVEDEFLSQQEVTKETMQKLEGEMALQKQQHLSYTETSKEILKSMEMKLNVREKELNNIQSKCLQNEEELEERKEEIIMLRRESECNEMEMKEEMKVISIREKECNELIREMDMKIKEHADSINSLKSKISSLQNEICEMKIVVESTTVGLQKEKLSNDFKDCTIEELNDNVIRITEEKMRMKIENEKNIADLALSKKVAEDEFLSQLEVAKETMQKVHEEMALQEQQHLSYTETSEEILKSMELKLNARENELDDIQVQQKEKLDEREKEIIRLREERESN